MPIRNKVQVSYRVD